MISTISTPSNPPPSIPTSITSMGTEAITLLTTIGLTWLVSYLRLRNPIKPVPECVRNIRTHDRYLDLLLANLVGVSKAEKIELAICHNGKLDATGISYDRLTWTNIIVADQLGTLSEVACTDVFSTLPPEEIPLNTWTKIRNRYYFYLGDKFYKLGVLRLTPSEYTTMEDLLEHGAPLVNKILNLVLAAQTTKLETK